MVFLGPTVAEMDKSRQDLRGLLAHLDPEMLPGRYVYVDLEQAAAQSVSDRLLLASVREPEGLCGVMRQEDADRLGLEYEFIGSWITLRVRSSLDGVGLTAAISAELAAAGIPCNVMAGLHHDHLLVPQEMATSALWTLEQVIAEA